MKRKRDTSSTLFQYEKFEPRKMLAGAELSLLENGGFGEGDLSETSDFYSSDEIPGWTSSVANQDQAFHVLRTSRNGQLDYVVDLDATSSQHDRIYQDVYTEIGATYVLSFDFRGRNGTSEFTNEFRVLWDGVFQQRFKAHDLWQNGTIELTAEKTGLIRLEFRELSKPDAPTGDGRGPMLDEIQLLRVHDQLIANGSFEDTGESQPPFHSNSDVSGWNATSTDPELRRLKVSALRTTVALFFEFRRFPIDGLDWR